jgi:hypothetical protein
VFPLHEREAVYHIGGLVLVDQLKLIPQTYSFKHSGVRPWRPCFSGAEGTRRYAEGVLLLQCVDELSLELELEKTCKYIGRVRCFVYVYPGVCFFAVTVSGHWQYTIC